MLGRIQNLKNSQKRVILLNKETLYFKDVLFMILTLDPPEIRQTCSSVKAGNSPAGGAILWSIWEYYANDCSIHYIYPYFILTWQSVQLVVDKSICMLKLSLIVLIMSSTSGNSG